MELETKVKIFTKLIATPEGRATLVGSLKDPSTWKQKFVLIDVYQKGWVIRPCEVRDVSDNCFFLCVQDHPGNANNSYRVCNGDMKVNMVVAEKHLFDTEAKAQEALKEIETP